VPLLLSEKTVLLDMQVRLHNLPELYGRKYLGHVMQWNNMGMPGLRRTKRIWEPIASPDKNNNHLFYEKINI
jgi:hypothetical protein